MVVEILAAVWRPELAGLDILYFSWGDSMVVGDSVVGGEREYRQNYS